MSEPYRFDLARYFFASPEAEQAKRAAYQAALQNLQALKGMVTASAAGLLRALQLYDRLQVQFLRHYTYLYLRHATDTRDQASAAACSTLDAEFEARTAFLRLELQSLDEETLSAFVDQEPALTPYRFALESARRYRPYSLTLKEEEIQSALSPLAGEWPYDLYRRLVARTPFGTIETEDGELDVMRQRAVIAHHPDPAVRQAGFRKLYAGYASQRDLYAFALINLVRARHRLAQLRHFEDAIAEVYFRSYWRTAEVRDLLERIAQHSAVYGRYQRLRRDQAGGTNVQLWDVPASLAGDLVPRFTIQEASQVIRQALAPLGFEYGRELARLLDPANGRLDILPGDNRLPGGFSKGFPGVSAMPGVAGTPGIPGVFYSGGFAGYYDDVRVLVHESTHAIHRQLMSNHHVLPAYADGPHYLFESFAMFHELLLADYLYQHDTDALRQRYYLEQFFDGKGMALFFIAQDAALEQAIYDGVKQGTITSADDLDALAETVNARFTIWHGRHDELKMRWITARLYYQDPLYEINYVYGALLALKYYELFGRDPQRFVPSYIALLANGFDAPPAVLLRRFLGLDPDDPGLLEDAVALLENQVDLLARAYAGPQP